MTRAFLGMTGLALVLCALPALAGGSMPEAPPPDAKAAGHGPADVAIAPKKSVTHGSVTVEGTRIGYEAVAGTLVLKNDAQEPIATMSYVAYFKDGVDDKANRPITFFYNGGPGSSTVWLHMLAFGPKLAKVGNGTLTPPAPWKLVNNDYSLLDATDMVFIDAPGTGFGRVIGKEKGGAGSPEAVFGIDEDAHAFAQFITRFITEYDRWNSPKFLFGESYGTTRSAVLANILESEKNVGLNGVILLSAILNWSLSVDYPQINPGVNISYATGLPSYAATAWYHEKLPGERPEDLKAFLDKVEQFAMGPYFDALNEGDRIDPATKKQVAEQMHRYTGLPTDYILEANLKVTGGEFAHELLDQGDRVTGRLDSRYSGPAMDPLGQKAQYDPMNSAISAPTVALFNAYVRNTLKFGEDMKYKPGINVFMQWNFSHQPPGAPFQLPFTPNVMPDLAAAMTLDPNLNILLTGGYMDLGTPYYAAVYSMHQLPIAAQLEDNISYHFFPSGHMVYLNPEAHKGLHDATAKFIEANYKNP
ncbi:MAG: peptidase S10 [Gammaproteobacteria bacterium]|nr:peptidase S10 [Gammaproteobacteria bacterium]